PLTKNKAKALLPIKGKPIIDYIVDEMWTMPDLEQIIVVSNHRFAADFAEWRKTRPNEDIIVIDDGTSSDEDKLGAIGDMQFVIEKLGIDDDFFVIAGDTLFTYKLKDAWTAFRTWENDMVLACEMPPGEDLTRYAIATVDETGSITSFEEKPANPKSNLAVFATYFYTRDTLPLISDYLAEGNSPDAPGHFPAWLFQRKTVKLFKFTGQCVDIGTPEAYAAVNQTWPEVC
ncbi:MAG TPA: nucleotidyltransferase family protein, partial [Clostridiaceae bacterium]|nr:nucleotidyltransferase family protein [Clostridiaceae bacterium]